jgi:hypothetical protein
VAPPVKSTADIITKATFDNLKRVIGPLSVNEPARLEAGQRDHQIC